MDSIYLIQTLDRVTINETIDKILQNNKIGKECVINYDLSDISLGQVISDLDTYNFLVSKKVVICDNCYFLETTKPKTSIEQKIEELDKYLDNPNPENILILISNKLDERKAIVKKLKAKATIISEEIAIAKVVKKRLEDFQMEDSVINYFIDYCGNDNEKILNELNKLMCYKAKEKIITKDDINNIVIKSFNDNVFSLIDAIMSKRREKAITLYEELIDSGEDMNKILSLIADQFRMIYNGRILLKEHNNNFKEVASLFGIHPYRFQKAIESSYNYSLKDVLKYLEKIDDIEIAVKTGKSTIAAFEVFIYSL